MSALVDGGDIDSGGWCRVSKPLKPSHQRLMSASSTQPRAVVASPALLDIRSEQARWVADGLIQQPLIAEALAEHYNLSAENLDGLLASAMQVRVLPSEQPDFQASVLLDLWRDPSQPDRLPETLASIRATLESRGFHPEPQEDSIRWFASADRERLLGGWSFNREDGRASVSPLLLIPIPPLSLSPSRDLTCI